MKYRRSSLRSIALLTGLLTTAIATGNVLNAHAAPAQTREAAIDWQTDLFLYKVNPELDGRKLQSDDINYIREWNAIRQAVDQEMQPNVTECAGDQYWELYSYDGINGLPSGRRSAPSFDRIADAIFYNRHPELVGTPLSSSSSDLTREWSQIRQAIMVEQPCS